MHCKVVLHSVLAMAVAATYPAVWAQAPAIATTPVTDAGHQAPVKAPAVLPTPAAISGAAPCQAPALMMNKLEANSRVLAAVVGNLAPGLGVTASEDPVTNKTTYVVDPVGSESVFIGQLATAYLKIPYASDCKLDPNQAAAQSTTSQTNKQTGAGASSDGTTSAVQQTGISQLLSIAEENGAVTSSSSGSTTTLSTSLYGILTGFKLIQDDAKDYKACYLCVRLGASATFNVASSTNQPASVSRKEISQWQLKYSFKDLSSRSPRVEKMWEDGPSKAASQLAADLNPPSDNSAAYAIWMKLAKALDASLRPHGDVLGPMIQSAEKANAAQTGSSSSTSTSPYSALAQQVLQFLDQDVAFQTEFNAAIHNPDFSNWVETHYAPSLSAYNTAESKFEADVADLTKGGQSGFNGDLNFGQHFPTTTASSSSASSSAARYPLAAASASSTPTPHLPDYLLAGMDLTWAPALKTNPKAALGGLNAAPVEPMAIAPSVTLNFNGSFYTEPNAALNETTFRGGKGAAQLQWNLGSGPFIKKDSNDKDKVTFSLNGSYERLQENWHQKGKRPDIVLGNFKLTIPVSSGVSFPLAVTFANAQEQQAKGTYAVGNFGISFDLDKLAALLKVQ